MGDVREQTCCFTGHRDLSNNDQCLIIERLEALIPDLINRGVKYFGVGGALGFDTIVTEYLLSIRTAYPQIRIIQVLPFDGYRSKWNAVQKARAKIIDEKVDATVYCYTLGSREAYLGRDERLVNESSYCIAYCKRNYGGTAYTIHYAQQRNLKIFNLAEENNYEISNKFTRNRRVND